MQEVLLNYFSKLFESSKPNTQHIDEILECVGRRVNDEMNESLNQHYTAEEIKTALNQMRLDKSPRPDGMLALFYQNFWRIVGPTTINSILLFLNNGILPSELNHIYIVLIPKCKNPEHVSQFWPISLCNVIYKIASKVLANRLKPMLDSIISENQSAFIPGRYITDNILIAFEVNHHLRNKRKGKEGVATLKLDMSKAYDRVEWAFLRRVLIKLGFYDTLICCQSNAEAFECVKEILEGMLYLTANKLILKSPQLFSAEMIPMTILHKLNSQMAIFFWNNGDRAKIHWLGWGKICKKMEDGGLGLRDLHSFNMAMLAKQAKKGSKSSYTWQSIWAAQDLVRVGHRWRIGRGTKVRIWKDQDADLILSIPLCRSADDRIIWHRSKKGKFTKFIWDLNVPPRIKMFAWKACRNVIPTIENLKKRRSPNFGRCPRCEHEMENVKHMLFDCTFARLTWALSDPPWHGINSWNSSCEDWMRNMSKLIVFQLACSKSSIISIVKHPFRWERPRSEFIKVNFDGAIFQQPKGPGAGILCRDPNGNCIDWLADFSPGVSAVDHAEAIALRKGVEFALRKGWKNVIFEGDCLQIINMLHQQTSDNSAMGVFISDIKEFCRPLGEFRFSFILREGNYTSHLRFKKRKKRIFALLFVKLQTKNLIEDLLSSVLEYELTRSRVAN
ncbi:UNVERIFIED_CONTAM: hypothetical protein Slati_0863900 [Sesamum latifolium]|uniref:Reverse transcriptase n=1 Tax=Sesamum latifolium TaxID=2727402 RepID=A0AAW2XM85_9LAMI